MFPKVLSFVMDSRNWDIVNHNIRLIMTAMTMTVT
jgi:hypothetical protein